MGLSRGLKPSRYVRPRDILARSARAESRRDGALISTMMDLSRFVAWELGSGPGTILSRAAQEENYSRVLVENMSGGYGVGFQVQRRGALVAYGHGGTTAGFLSQALFDRESKTGVIVFRNVTGGRLKPSEIGLRVLEIVSRKFTGRSGRSGSNQLPEVHREIGEIGSNRPKGHRKIGLSMDPIDIPDLPV